MKNGDLTAVAVAVIASGIIWALYVAYSLTLDAGKPAQSAKRSKAKKDAKEPKKRSRKAA